MIKQEEYLKAKQIVQKYEKQLDISDVSCSSFDNSQIELVHKIRKQRNYGICDIKVALLKSNYDIDKAIEFLSINKYRIA